VTDTKWLFAESRSLRGKNKAAVAPLPFPEFDGARNYCPGDSATITYPRQIRWELAIGQLRSCTGPGAIPDG
jgi:hypothetical protein